MKFLCMLNSVLLFENSEYMEEKFVVLVTLAFLALFSFFSAKYSIVLYI